MLTINNNPLALMAANNMLSTYGQMQKSINALSTGMRISSAADDAAGLAVREIFRSQVAVLGQGIRNVSDAISMLQTMDGAAAVIDEKLIRMKELAEQAATGTYTSVQRQIMQAEFAAMRDEINRIANATQFNGVRLLNCASSNFAGAPSITDMHLNSSGHPAAAGAGLGNHGVWTGYRSDNANSGAGVKIHFGTENVAGQDFYAIRSFDLTESGLGIMQGAADINNPREYGTGGAYIGTQASAQATLEILTRAIVRKDSARAHFGAMQNRLENTARQLTIQRENINAAESRISDIDVALEMTNFINLQMKTQAAIAMLSQANMVPQMAMQLLGG